MGMQELFVFYADRIGWYFALNAIEEMEAMVKDVRKSYDKKKLSPSYFMALLNFATIYLEIMKEEKEHG